MSESNEDYLDVILDDPESETSGTKPARELTGWQVFAFSLAIGIAYVVGSTIPVIMIAMSEAANNPAFDPEAWSENIYYDGFALSVSALGASLLSVPGVFFAAYYQKSVSCFEYLALRKVSWLSCLKWMVVVLLLIACSDGLTHLLGKEIVPEFVRRVYTSPGALPWLWIALIILAPLSEELFFRGFLFTGLQSNGVGVIGTAIITSLLWAIIHLQYGPYEIGMIFLGGLVLSYARVRSGSIIPCLLMHAIANLVATIEADLVTS